MAKMKSINKKEMKEALITKWYQLSDYDLKMVNIYSPSWAMTLNLVYGNFDEFKKFFADKHKKEVEYEACVAFFCSDKIKGIQHHYMVIQDQKFRAKDYGSIAHELHHFVHFALEEKGMEYHKSSEEAFAYLQGYFMEMTVRAFAELDRHEKENETKKPVRKKKKIGGC